MQEFFGVVVTLFLANHAIAQNPAELSFDDGELLARLQKGGLVIAFRHGATGPDPDRPDALTGLVLYPGSAVERQQAYLDCERQRVLSEAGRADMRKVSAAIRQIGIQIGEVFASPLCRTRESAWLLVGQVMPADFLIGPENPARDHLLNTPPVDGSNRILVSHSYVIKDIIATPENPLDREAVPRGHCLVLEPQDGNDSILLAMLGPDDWVRLAERAQW